LTLLKHLKKGKVLAFIRGKFYFVAEYK
jgi:hypothetical protein